MKKFKLKDSVKKDGIYTIGYKSNVKVNEFIQIGRFPFLVIEVDEKNKIAKAIRYTEER